MYYKVDRESFLESEPIENRLSCFYLDYDYPQSEYYVVANTYILDSFHSLFNFITDENSPSVVIDPETTSSFCGLVENKIQLGTKIFADSRFSQQQKVDSMFAVMLHEMWHKRYTNKSIQQLANAYKGYDSDTFYYNNPLVASYVKKILPTQLHVDLLNVFEDHRIERMGLEEFPGYVFYFDSLREYIFSFQKLKKISVSAITGTIVEYLMFKVLIPEMFPWFVKEIEDAYISSSAVPQIRREDLFKIFDKFDRYLKDNEHLAYSDNLADLLKVVNDLIAMLPPDVKKNLEEQKKKFTSAHGECYLKVDEKDFSDEGYDKAIDDIHGEIGKMVEEIEKGKANLGKETSDAESVRIEGYTVIDVHNSVYDTVKIYRPVPGPIDQKLMTEAKRTSGHISRDLGFLASKLNQSIMNYELREGDLDEDELYSIGYSKDIFMEEETLPGFELDFGILMDQSGSMAGKKMLKTVIAAAGITMACLPSSYVNMFVYGHTQSDIGEDHTGVKMYEYINTKRRIRDHKTIFTAKGHGGNADGYAIAKMGEIMLKDSRCNQKVMVVISDGLPAAIGYGGESAEKHVRQVVDALEHKGIEVIQLCIDNIERSQYMFKNYIPYDEKGNFGKKLREIMQKKLTRFMESI